MNQPEFDRYSPSYEDLLKDPIRDRFMAGESTFFHGRKRDLIRGFFRDRGIDTRSLSYLDVGCGKGELVSMLHDDFDYTAGCDPSAGMLSFAQGIDTRVQDNPEKIPFETERFDFVTAVCVYHHVPVAARLHLTREISRVLKPGGMFAIIEHNPYNPVTRSIVSRTPVDADAILLKSREAGGWMLQAGLTITSPHYFLYLPEPLYRRGGRRLEGIMRKIPLGGQYAVFGTKAKVKATT